MFASVQDVNLYAELTKFPILEKIPRKSKFLTASKNVINCVCAFDIETTTIDLGPKGLKKSQPHAFMYVWQFQLQDITIIGRTWDECFQLFNGLADACLRIQQERKWETIPLLIIWIHNAAYEFAWLSGLYPFENEDCFFRDARKPIYFRMFKCLEFRCSYIQTNMSLSHLTKQMKVEEKLSGQKYDYNKIRFPWTPLSDYELEYCTRDVKSLVACMAAKMANDGDTLQTIPLTSTGYVRRDCVEALKPRRLDIKEILPDERRYRLLRSAFRGGNTHCNVKYSGKILENVYSYDMSSCYPAQQLTKKFPISKFQFLDDRLSMDRISKFLGLGYAVVARYQFKGLQLKRGVTIPYLSYMKDCFGARTDNGRVISAEYCEYTLTEIDLQIVMKQYTFKEIGVLSAMVAQKAYLPDEYRNVVRKYYTNKTKLKGVKDPELEYLYAKSKSYLNSIYGMSAQHVLHQNILYDDGEYNLEELSPADIDKELSKAKFPYQWGVYTTAYARAALQEAIDLAKQNMVYCDTDSVKTLGKIDLSLLNKKRQNMAVEHRAFADDPSGTRHYMGVFEEECKYDRFISCGAKRYAYEIDGEMGITVSGVTHEVNEKTGLTYAVEELGCLENFHEGFIWHKAAGNIAIYNDNADFDYTDPETGKQVHISKNVALVPCTYEMKYSRSYVSLLTELGLYTEYKKARE